MCDPAGLALERMCASLIYRKIGIIFISIYCLVFCLPVSADCGDIDGVHSIILLSSFFHSLNYHLSVCLTSPPPKKTHQLCAKKNSSIISFAIH